MKKYFATYIIDQNPNSGAFVTPVEAKAVRATHNYKIILKDTFGEMIDYCRSLIELDIQDYPEDYVRICENDNGVSLIDNEDYQVLRYDIHEINL